MTPATPDLNHPELSIIVPALNEQDNVQPLVEEIQAVMANTDIEMELIVVDDGSSDQTPVILQRMRESRPWLRVLRRERPQGQSAAMGAGIQAARGRWIATLDADLQNDPADLPLMLQKLRRGEADMVQGDRSANRRDSLARRWSSWVGRTTRRVLLGDVIRDTGCSARMLDAAIARQFPLQFKGLHRFMPVYARLLGSRVIEMPVRHRPRVAGQTKYGMLNRGLSGLIDCLAVRWMSRRYRDPRVREMP